MRTGARSAATAPACGGRRGIDAAQMRSHRGPDRIANGLALCALHHRLFDRGALGVDEDLRILVSQHVTLREPEAPVPVMGLVGEPMRPPQPGYDAPATSFMRWHYRNLFVGPQRHPARPGGGSRGPSARAKLPVASPCRSVVGVSIVGRWRSRLGAFCRPT